MKKTLFILVASTFALLSTSCKKETTKTATTKIKHSKYGFDKHKLLFISVFKKQENNSYLFEIKEMKREQRHPIKEKTVVETETNII